MKEIYSLISILMLMIGLKDYAIGEQYKIPNFYYLSQEGEEYIYEIKQYQDSADKNSSLSYYEKFILGTRHKSESSVSFDILNSSDAKTFNKISFGLLNPINDEVFSHNMENNDSTSGLIYTANLNTNVSSKVTGEIGDVFYSAVSDPGLTVYYDHESNSTDVTKSEQKTTLSYGGKAIEDTLFGKLEVLKVNIKIDTLETDLPPISHDQNNTNEWSMTGEAWLVNGLGCIYKKTVFSASFLMELNQTTERTLIVKPANLAPQNLIVVDETSSPQLDSWTWNGAFPWVYNSSTESWFYYAFTGNTCNAYDARSGSWFTYNGATGVWNQAN
jgi:hypothetical protein